MRDSAKRVLFLLACTTSFGASDDKPLSEGNLPPLKYEYPASLTGVIYSLGGDRQALFRFRRKAVRSGRTLNVLREYTYPDGRLAVRERVEYEGNQLKGFEWEELQTGEQGKIELQHAGAEPDKGVVHFEYTKSSGARPKTNEEPLHPNLVNDDMIAPFITDHWAALMRGEVAKCRYLSVPRRETVGFTFVKESESQWHGSSVVIIRMEPTSTLIAAFIDPIRLTMEKEGQHHVLEYVGRAAPKIQKGTKWSDLEALTLFDW